MYIYDLQSWMVLWESGLDGMFFIDVKFLFMGGIIIH